MTCRTSRQLIAGLAVFGAAACVFPTDVCGCTYPPPSAWLEGTVVNGAGAAIPNARVFVFATRDTAAPSANYLYGQGALTNARGEFRAEVGGFSPEPVWVHATIIRSGADTVRVRGGTVALGTDLNSRPTVRMTFQLP